MTTQDMTPVIAPKADQLTADDLLGGERTIRITRVEISPGTEQPISIFFEGDNGKPWRPCKSTARLLVAAWGADAKVYTGRSATLYRDDSVTWGAVKVGGVRVSHLSHIETEMVLALTVTRGKKAPTRVKPLKATVAPLKAVATETTEPQTGFDWTAFEADTETAIRHGIDPDALKYWWDQKIETRKLARADDKDRAGRLATTVQAKIAELTTDLENA